MKNVNKEPDLNWAILFICFIIATVSTLGSLFFSEIMELPPCDRNAIKYALPVAIAGWGTAFYHFLLYSGFIPESIQPCSQGVSCSETYLDLFGFLTIPLLSLISFSTIIVLLIFLKRRLSK